MKRVAYGLAVLLLAHAVAGETIERSVDAAPDGEVEIVNVAGDVRVIGWNRAQVELSADTSGGVEQVQFETHGDRTSIRVKAPGNGHSGSASLHVRVPQNSRLLVNTVSASQTIEGVRGEQRLQSVSGEIRSEAWQEEFQAKSVSGAITVTGKGPTIARITTVSGSIDLQNVGGELDLSTVNGAMHIDGGRVGRARLKSTNGGMRFEAALDENARLDAQAINGAIDMRLQGAPNAEFDIETFNGAIRNCFGPQPQRTHEHAPGSTLRFKEGRGSARVRLKTLNGPIELCRKKG